MEAGLRSGIKNHWRGIGPLLIIAFLVGSNVTSIANATGIDRDTVKQGHKLAGQFIVLYGCVLLLVKVLATATGLVRQRIPGVLGLFIRNHWILVFALLMNQYCTTELNATISERIGWTREELFQFHGIGGFLLFCGAIAGFVAEYAVTKFRAGGAGAAPEHDAGKASKD